nr:MAG TPA: minor tail protein [Caudoviricetes sp.]
MATRTISTRLAVEGESEYRASITRINSEIKSLQSALKLTESQYQTNANSMAALTAKGKALSDLYKAQESKVKQLKEALNNARDAEQKYAQQKATITAKIESNNRALERLKNTAADTSEEEAKLAAENKELQAQLEKCDANLAAAEKGVNSWQTQLNNAQVRLNDLDAEIQLNNEYMDEARESADGCATSIDRFGDRVKESANKADTLRDALAAAGVIAALKKTADALEACVDASIEFESAMAGVAKTTDMTQAELGDMADAIQDLSTRIPATTTEIAGVAEAAGQLGIAKDDILAFSEVMVNLGVATNLSSDEAASALAKFANVVGMSADNYERLGSTIVDLGNNFATTEADIVSMATRLSSTGAIIGLTEPQIMAIATALSSVGIEAEAGGSAISKLLKQFETMVATGSDKLESFANIAGMSAAEFSQKWGEDAVGALSAFINGLGEIDAAGGSSVAVLDELGITEVRLSNAVQALASSHGILDKALATADTAWQNNTALAKEAATRYETTESKLQMLSNACNNAKIAIGDKLTPAVGNLAETGTKLLTGIADSIDQSNLLVPIITSVATAIAVLAAGITAYTVVTKLAAAAMALFTAVLDTNPIFLAITAIAALAAGIGVLVATLKDDATPSVKELTEAASALPDAFDAANASYKESETRVLATTAAAEKYIDRLRELEAQGVSTNAAQSEYQQIVDKLRYLLPDVNIELDEQTGLLVGGANALYEQVDAWKAVALQQALTTKYEAQIKAWGDAYVEVEQNRVKLNQAEADAAVIESRIADIQKEMAANQQKHNAVMEDSTLSASEATQAHQALFEEYAGLSMELTDLNKQLKSNSKEQDNLNEAIKTGEETASGYEQQVDEAQAALDAFMNSANSAADGTNGLSDAMGNQSGAAQIIRDQITQLAQDYKDAYDAAYESINGQIGLFDTFAAEVSDDTNTVEKMMERWAEQTANLAAYTENLKKAAQYGLDDGLVQSLSDGSTESAGYLATIISEIEKLGGTTEGMSNEAAAFVDEFNAAFNRTNEAKESFAETVAAIQTHLDDAIAQMQESAANIDFSGFNEALESSFANVGVNLQEIGLNAGAGLSQGLADSSGDVAGAAAGVADDATNAAKSALGVHSPSTVWLGIGENADLGLAQGIRSNTQKVISEVKTLARQMETEMRTAGRNSVNGFDTEFAQVQTKTRSQIDALKATVSGASSGLPGTMSSVGVQMINGMISGLNSRSSALYATVRSIVNQSIATAKKAAAVRSPSRKTTEIFEQVGEGMVVGLENKRKKVAATAQRVVDDALKLDIKAQMPVINDTMPSIDTSRVNQPVSENVEINNDFHIGSLVVREDADVKRIANELYKMQRTKSRGKGVAKT